MGTVQWQIWRAPFLARGLLPVILLSIVVANILNIYYEATHSLPLVSFNWQAAYKVLGPRVHV